MSSDKYAQLKKQYNDEYFAAMRVRDYTAAVEAVEKSEHLEAEYHGVL